MCKKAFFILVIITNLSSFAQKEKELFRVDNTPVMVSEFKQVYEKNLEMINDDEAKDVEKYLNLYINYKLKIKEAYSLQLDTLKKYKRELAGYKTQLIAPYLQDEVYLQKLIKETYERTKNEVKASHILIKFPKNKEIDTLVYFNRIDKIRNRIVKGENFNTLAKEVSEDPSAKINGGNLGYFSAFKMVYPFEDAAYKTKIGEVSKPFKTRFGYHIILVTDKRKSKGEFEVAHILIKKDNPKSKSKIDSLYNLLNKGAAFENIAKNFSEDLGTKQVGGKLPKFGTGTMVDAFEENVRSLKTEGSYSKPFKTRFGWHIVKLLKNYPIKSFEETKIALEKKIKKSNRAGLSKLAVINKLKKEYKIKENEKVIATFLNSENKEGNLKETILTINDKKISSNTFSKFLKKRRKTSVKKAFEEFKNNETLNYFKDDLINKEPSYKNTLLEYKEGLLLFDLMQQKIWNKSANDTLGLKQFYLKNKLKYAKSFKEIRGKVMNDYQKELENKWVDSLKNTSVIKIKRRELNKLKKHYNN